MLISRRIASRLPKIMLLLLACLMLTNMTACSPRYVAVNGDELIQVKKGELDQLHQDNELLIKGLQECQSK